MKQYIRIDTTWTVARLGRQFPESHVQYPKLKQGGRFLKSGNLMDINEWWKNDALQRYWLEVTDRPDIGTNLKAPQSNEHEREFWSYQLVKFVREGDVVFHYHKAEQAVVAYSVAASSVWEDFVVWVARGVSARNAGIRPHSRPGWYLGLEKYTLLDRPLTLEQIRYKRAAIVEQLVALKNGTKGPLYFPFELSDKRAIRPMQGYLFKLPHFFVEEFTQLASARSVAPAQKRENEFATPYRRADEEGSVAECDPFSKDPALVERALHSHAVTQNALANFLAAKGMVVLSPGPSEPNFDIAWTDGRIKFVAEVKSLTDLNEEKQLRLGLGQVLRYRHRLGSRATVQAVLVAARQPRDASWIELCESVDVLLVWPDSWSHKI